jgi:hypothetical protein
MVRLIAQFVLESPHNLSDDQVDEVIQLAAMDFGAIWCKWKIQDTDDDADSRKLRLAK